MNTNNTTNTNTNSNPNTNPNPNPNSNSVPSIWLVALSSFLRVAPSPLLVTPLATNISYTSILFN